MASGRLGVSNPAATTDTVVYTVPAGTITTCNVRVTNIGSSEATVSVALALTSTPTNGEYVAFQVSLPSRGTLDDYAFVLSAGENVVVNCSTADCAVRVHGFEEAV